MSFTSTHLPPTPLPGLPELHSDRLFCLCSCINWRPFPTIIWHDLLKMLHESEPVTLLLWKCLMTCHWPEDEVLPCLPGLTGNFKNRAGALSLSLSMLYSCHSTPPILCTSFVHDNSFCLEYSHFGLFLFFPSAPHPSCLVNSKSAFWF